MAATSRLRCLGSTHRRDSCECAVPVRPCRSWHRLDYRVVSTPGRVMEGVFMVFLTNVLFGLFFVVFSYWMVIARTRRQVLALSLAGVLAVALVSPPQAHAQGSLVVAIQSVLNVINGMIKTALNSINSARTAISNFYQQATWPVALINRAKAMVTQMVGQYRGLMQNIFSINLKSATLPNPIGLENAMRNHQTNDFASLTSSFGTTYGSVPGRSHDDGHGRRTGGRQLENTEDERRR